MNIIDKVKDGERVAYQTSGGLYKRHKGTVVKVRRADILVHDDLTKVDVSVPKSGTYMEYMCTVCGEGAMTPNSKCVPCEESKKTPPKPDADGSMPKAKRKMVYKSKPCCDCDTPFTPTGARDVRCFACKIVKAQAEEAGTEYVTANELRKNTKLAKTADAAIALEQALAPKVETVAPEEEPEQMPKVVDNRPDRFCECQDCRKHFQTKDPDKLLCDKCECGGDKLDKLCDNLAAAGERAAAPKSKKKDKNQRPEWAIKMQKEREEKEREETKKTITETIPEILKKVESETSPQPTCVESDIQGREEEAGTEKPLVPAVTIKPASPKDIPEEEAPVMTLAAKAGAFGPAIAKIRAAKAKVRQAQIELDEAELEFLCVTIGIQQSGFPSGV